MSLISLFLNVDVTNTFEFVGKKAVTFVSIFLKLARSILICLNESSRKTFFCMCFGFFIVLLYFSNIIFCLYHPQVI